MSYRFSNTSGVIGKHVSLSTTGTSGLFNIQQCYEGMLTGDYPLPPPDYVGYNPRFHDASTNPGDALVKDTELQLFMEETIQKLHEMKQRQIDEDLQQVTNGFCAPGVNCE